MSKCTWKKQTDVDEFDRCNNEASFVITVVHDLHLTSVHRNHIQYERRCDEHTSEILDSYALDPTAMRSLIVVAIE